MNKSLSFIIVTLFTFMSFSQTLNDSLKLHLLFEQNYADSSGKNNDFSVNRPTVQFVSNSSPFGTNILFDGLNRPSLRTINNFPTNTYNACAISFWFKSEKSRSANSIHRQVIIQGSQIGFAALIQNGTNKLHVFFDGSSAGAAQSVQPVVDSVWHNVIFQTNGSFTDLYIDGNLNSRISETYAKGNGSSTNRIFLGNTATTNENFEGELDEVRIYNRILTGAEIAVLSTRPVVTGLPKEASKTVSDYVIYPNPSNGVITIKTEQENIIDNISIRNVKGQLVKTISHSLLNSNVINLEGVKSGIYYIIITEFGGKEKVLKMIKE